MYPVSGPFYAAKFGLCKVLQYVGFVIGLYVGAFSSFDEQTGLVVSPFEIQAPDDARVVGFKSGNIDFESVTAAAHRFHVF